MAPHPRSIAALLATLLLVVSGCADDDRGAHPTDPGVETTHEPLLETQLDSGVLPARPELPDMTREFQIDLTEHPSSTEATESELIASIAAQEGRVFIGLKPETAPRTRDTGIVPPMGRDDRNVAHEYLESRGVVIEQVYVTFPTVYAVVPLDEVASLANDPRVNYIEPIGSAHLHVLPRTEPASIPVSLDAFAPLLTESLERPGVDLIEVPVSYADDHEVLNVELPELTRALELP